MPVDEKVEPQVFGSDGVGFYEFGDDFFEVVLGIVVLDSQELVLDAVNKQAADILLRDEQDRLFLLECLRSVKTLLKTVRTNPKSFASC